MLDARRKNMIHKTRSCGPSGGFRGCSWGQLPPSFMMKTQLGAPFSARRAPLILTQMHSFFVFRSEFGEHINQGVIEVKNQRIFPE